MSFNTKSPVEDYINQYAQDKTVAEQIFNCIGNNNPVQTQMKLIPVKWILENYDKCYADQYSLQRFLKKWESDRSNSYLTTMICGLNYKDTFQLAEISPVINDLKRKIDSGECSVAEITAYKYAIEYFQDLLDKGHLYLILDGQHRLKEIYDYLTGNNDYFQTITGFPSEGFIKYIDDNGNPQMKPYPLSGNFKKLPGIVQANILLNVDVPINFITTGSLKVLGYVFYAINNGLPLSHHENRTVLSNNNLNHWLIENILKDRLREDFWNYIKLGVSLEQKGDTLFFAHFIPWFLLQQDDPQGSISTYTFSTVESDFLFKDNFMIKEKYLSDIKSLWKIAQSMIIKYKPKPKLKYSELFDLFYVLFKFNQQGIADQKYKIEHTDDLFAWFKKTQKDRIERDRWVTTPSGEKIEAKHSYKSKLSRMSKENFEYRINEINKDISRDLPELITSGIIVAIGSRKSSLTIEDVAYSNNMLTGAGKPISKYDLYSERGENLEINEVLPVSKGGKRTLDNVTIETPRDNKILYNQVQK